PANRKRRGAGPGAMAAADGDDSLYPIAVLIDELRNEDVQVPRGGPAAGPRCRPLLPLLPPGGGRIYPGG
uniref:Uncharacterized protein n=1 Tax=Anser brachyrhynchus TaxID=132585 RepID=A0A8B9CEE1_9AVES